LPEQSGLFLFACGTAALLIYAHRGNIRRMLNGTESRFARPALGRLLGGK
jgi:glycerol-3-phosphate acyltransferase PlsY